MGILRIILTVLFVLRCVEETALDAGEDVYSRNDHSAGQQGDAGIKKLNLADRMVQVYLPLDIRAVGDHDSHGHAEREEQLAHGVQKNLQETAHGQPLHVGREIVAEPRKAGAELAAFVRMLKGCLLYTSFDVSL